MTSQESSAVEAKETQERRESSSSSDTEHHDLEKQPEDGTTPAERVQSSTESIYPSGKETAAVLVALMLAIFLVALVCRNAAAGLNKTDCVPRTERSSPQQSQR